MSIQIGVLIAIGGLLLSFLSYQLAKSKEVKTDTRESAELRTELGYIRKGVDDIRIDLKANEKQMAHLSERVTRVEESSKQAHKRIDSLEEGGRLG
jgi:septal ring factor EnvC (AmiA/AmiB activator)